MKNDVLRWVAGVGIVIALAVAAVAVFMPEREYCHNFKEGKLEIDGKAFSVAVAATNAEKGQGLMGCTEIPRKSGMYFPYDNQQDVQFWMRGMIIPIDIVWVAEGKVVGIEENVPPVEDDNAQPPLYRPAVPVDGVLEMGAGKAAAYGITEGTTVTYLE